MQSKQNQKQNPQVNPVHHCAKCNNPLEEWILPAEYFLWHALWNHQKSACLCVFVNFRILNFSPLCQHSSSPPWRRSLSSCWPWHFSASSTKHIPNLRRQIFTVRGTVIKLNVDLLQVSHRVILILPFHLRQIHTAVVWLPSLLTITVLDTQRQRYWRKLNTKHILHHTRAAITDYFHNQLIYYTL